jgi:hypothetical protein
MVVAQLADEATPSRLRKLHDIKFKDSTVEVRLFDSISSFQKFIRLHCPPPPQLTTRLMNQETAPMLYILNFRESEDSLRTLFSRCGRVTSVASYPYRHKKYFTLSFSTVEAALLACRTFRGVDVGDGPMVVAPLYRGAAERCIAVHGMRDVEWLKRELEVFGVVEQVKWNKEGSVFVMMRSMDSAKAACVLLNGRVVGDDVVSSHFVDYEYFVRIMCG